MKKINKKLTLSLMMCSQAIPFAMAENDQPALEEVLVTAEKREASIQDVPIAVSAFQREMQDDLGIAGTTDIANLTPSMTYTSNPNRIFIRGVGRVENSLGSEPGVAIYQDGIYSNEVGAVPDSTFFLDRIEVLRGPQGTLYGRNAIGGAASIYSRKPTQDFQGEVRLGAYSFGGQQLGLALSGPINEKVRYRIAAESDNNDGWTENIAGDDVNDKGITRWEAQLDVDFTDELNVWIKYEDYDWDQNRTGDVMISPYNTESPGPLIGDFSSDFEQLLPNPQLGYTEENPGVNDIHKVNWDEPGKNTLVGYRATAHVTYDFDKARLKYIYGYSDSEWDYLGDVDQTSRSDNRELGILAQYEKYEQHEIQLISNLGGNIEYILGLFSWESENFQPLAIQAPDSAMHETPVFADPAGAVCYCVLDAPANPDRYAYYQSGDLDTDAKAAYGQLDFTPNDKWHVSLGVRYSEDKKEGVEKQRIIFDGQGTYAFMFQHILGMAWNNVATPTPGPQARIAWDFYGGEAMASHKNDWSSTDWSLGVDYKPTDNRMIYGKVSTGYKSGGYRLGSLQADPAVDEETVVAWELGMKNQFDRAIVNLAAYYYDYEDMQVPVDAYINGISNRLFENAEKANQFGIEADLQWLVSDAFTVYATYSYMDTEIETMGSEVFDSTAQFPVLSDLAGNELIGAPKHQYSLIGDYTWNLSSGSLKLVASYFYRDEQWSSIFNREDTQVPSFERSDLRLTYRNNADSLRVSAYVRNVFDEDIYENITRDSFYENNQLSASVQPPRISGIEVNYSF